MIRQQVVEKHIPIPAEDDKYPSRYAIKYMDVGDSFVHIDKDAETNRKFWNRVNGVLYSYAKRYGIKITVRKISNRSVRVWRTA